MGNLFGSTTVQEEPTARIRPVTNQESARFSDEYIMQLCHLASQATFERPRSTQMPSSSTQVRSTNPAPVRDYAEYRRQSTYNEYRNPTVQVPNTTISSKNKELCSIKPVAKSNELFILQYIDSYAQDLNWDLKNYSEQSVYFVELKEFSLEYKRVECVFKGTNKRCFEITKIERIQNPFLLAAFLLKQEEMESRIGEQDIEELFHGTRSENVMKICTNNFDYKLYGQNKGNKFGQGISFTPISNYATHYADEGCDNRVMLLVHVLVGEECIGKPTMILPDKGSDTSIKKDRHVIVKYEDNEFYPAYKITYSCTDPEELRKRTRNNQTQRVRKQRNNRCNKYLYDYEY